MHNYLHIPIFLLMIQSNSLMNSTTFAGLNLKAPERQDTESLELHPGIHVQKRGLHITHDGFDEVNEMLDMVIIRLKSYVKESNFDSKTFERYADSIENRINQISDWAKINSHYMGFIKRIQFAQRMVSMMKAAMDYLNYFNLDRIDHKFVRDVVQLKVQILAFFDSQGAPYPYSSEEKGNISRFINHLKLRKISFEKIPNVPLSSFYMFHLEVKECQKLLNGLIGS